jgi:uncharacterized protein (TIGR02246 family)
MSEQEIVDLVQRWAKVELDADVDVYAEILAPDFVGVGPVGFVLNREQWAARHANGMVNHELTVSDPHVRRYGDTAIVEAVESQRTTAMGHENNASFRLGVVVVRQDDRWVIAHIQFSGPLIAPGEAPPFARKQEG